MICGDVYIQEICAIQECAIASSLCSKSKQTVTAGCFSNRFSIPVEQFSMSQFSEITWKIEFELRIGNAWGVPCIRCRLLVINVGGYTIYIYIFINFSKYGFSVINYRNID